MPPEAEPKKRATAPGAGGLRHLPRLLHPGGGLRDGPRGHLQGLRLRGGLEQLLQAGGRGLGWRGFGGRGEGVGWGGGGGLGNPLSDTVSMGMTRGERVTFHHAEGPKKAPTSGGCESGVGEREAKPGLGFLAVAFSCAWLLVIWERLTNRPFRGVHRAGLQLCASRQGMVATEEAPWAQPTPPNGAGPKSHPGSLLPCWVGRYLFWDDCYGISRNLQQYQKANIWKVV